MAKCSCWLLLLVCYPPSMHAHKYNIHNSGSDESCVLMSKVGCHTLLWCFSENLASICILSSHTCTCNLCVKQKSPTYLLSLHIIFHKNNSISGTSFKRNFRTALIRIWSYTVVVPIHMYIYMYKRIQINVWADRHRECRTFYWSVLSQMDAMYTCKGKFKRVTVL